MNRLVASLQWPLTVVGMWMRYAIGNMSRINCFGMCIPRFAIPVVAMVRVGLIDVVAAPIISDWISSNNDEHTHCGTYVHLFWLVNISPDTVLTRIA